MAGGADSVLTDVECARPIPFIETEPTPMNTSNLVRKLVAVANWPEADITHKARRLREAGFLPQGGHGVNAPDAKPFHAANLLLALAAAETGKYIVKEFTPYLALESKRGDVLVDVLADVLADVGEANKIELVTVSRSHLWAKIEWRDGRSEEFKPAQPKPERSTGMRQYVTIDRMTLKEVAQALSESEAGNKGMLIPDGLTEEEEMKLILGDSEDQ